MKHILLISLLFLSLSVFGQQRKEEYKDYKVCTQCFDSDKWKKTGLDSYGISPQKKKRSNGYLSRTGKTILGGISAIVVGAITLSIYNSVNNATSNIH